MVAAGRNWSQISALVRAAKLSRPQTTGRQGEQGEGLVLVRDLPVTIADGAVELVVDAHVTQRAGWRLARPFDMAEVIVEL